MADEKKASAKPEKSSKPAKKSDAKADKSKAKKAKKNPFKSIGSFFKSVKSEGKKYVPVIPNLPRCENDPRLIRLDFYISTIKPFLDTL